MDFFVNSVNGGLVAGLNSQSSVNPPDQTVLDNPAVNVYFVNAGAYTDFSSHTLKLGVGLLNQYPTAGTWTLTFGGQTTSALAYNISAAALQSALEALATIGAGNVSVASGGVGEIYLITFTGALALAPQALLVADGLLLSPLSSVIVSENVVGDGTHNEVQSIALKQFPAVQISNWAALGSPTYGFSGELPLAQYAVLLYLLSQTNKAFTLEIESISPAGRKTTWVQAPINIRTKLIPGGTLNLPVAPTPLNPLYLAPDQLTYVKYNSTTHKIEFWVDGNLTTSIP